jgi:hypothetical protein
VFNEIVSTGAEGGNSDNHQQRIPQFFRFHHNSEDSSRPYGLLERSFNPLKMPRQNLSALPLTP